MQPLQEDRTLNHQKLPRREREKLRQRQEILTAALGLFSEKGYHNVSMQEIAETAEFATGTLYKFFQNNLPFVRLFLAESKGASFNLKAGLDEELRGRVNAFLAKLALVFENGMKSGRFQKIADPFALAVALDSVIDAFLLRWLDSPGHNPYPEDPDAILNIFLHPLLSP